MISSFIVYFIAKKKKKHLEGNLLAFPFSSQIAKMNSGVTTEYGRNS